MIASEVSAKHQGLLFNLENSGLVEPRRSECSDFRPLDF